MASPTLKNGMRLSEALDNMQLAYNPITKQLHFVSPKVVKKTDSVEDVDRLSKKSSFSDEGNFSISTCEKSDTSDSPKSTLQWGGSVSGHKRGKDGGSFSSNISSLSESSLASRDEEVSETATEEQAKLKKKGLSSFFSKGVFPWKSSKATETSSGSSWRLFGSKSNNNLAPKTINPECPSLSPTPSNVGSPHHQHHKRQGSSASEKQFEDLVASSIALIQHDRPSNLPAKCTEEALRHKAEHARMVEAARRKMEREAAERHTRLQESLKMEERLARHAKEWTQNILPEWHTSKKSKRTLELWWSGLPPSIRGRVWQLAIENKLNISPEIYQELVNKAKRKLSEAQQRRKKLKINENTCGCKNKLNDNERFGSEKDLSFEQESTSKEFNVSQEFKEQDSDSKTELRLKDSDSITELRLKDSDPKTELRLKDSDPKMELNLKDSDPKTELRLKDSDPKTELRQDSEFKSELRHSKTDDSLCEEKRVSIPRNFSEQNLKSSNHSCCSHKTLFEYSDECSMELIQLDIARTFPHLCIFQPGGPYFDVLHELLAAYVCYRPDIGYVQGMSFIAAVLILNMEASSAFICFCNLLDGPVLRAAFTRDGLMMQRLWKAYSVLLRSNVPLVSDVVAPELYLVEWLYTAFAKAMPLDATCRVWDVFLRDGDTFLFNTALGILHLYQDELKDMDFISAAQFLTKLPEDLCPEALFKSISTISMCYEGMSFEELVSCCEIDSSLDDDFTVRL